MSTSRSNYILKTDNNKTRNTKDVHDTKFEIGSQEAIYEIGSSSDSSDEYDEGMEVEIEIESSREERKIKDLNKHFMTHYKSNINKPETTKNRLASTRKFSYHNNIELRRSYNNVESCKSKKTANPEKYLMREQKNLNYQLRLAVEKGDTTTILKILKNNRHSKQCIVDLNYQGQDKWTLLHIATNEGNFDVVKILLENGANPSPQSVNQRTSLHIA